MRRVGRFAPSGVESLVPKGKKVNIPSPYRAYGTGNGNEVKDCCARLRRGSLSFLKVLRRGLARVAARALEWLWAEMEHVRL
jgi:hypothetical protein